MKKGQIEIMGLLIVVILIIMAAMFYVKFVVLAKKPVDQTSRQNIQATNLINAIMNLRVCDNTVTIKDSLILCGNKEPVCNEQDSCKYIEDQLVPIIDLTLDYKHSFYVKKGDEEIIKIDNCNNTGIASPAYTFSDKGTIIESYFMLCGKE